LTSPPAQPTAGAPLLKGEGSIVRKFWIYIPPLPPGEGIRGEGKKSKIINV